MRPAARCETACIMSSGGMLWPDYGLQARGVLEVMLGSNSKNSRVQSSSFSKGFPMIPCLLNLVQPYSGCSKSFLRLPWAITPHASHLPTWPWGVGACIFDKLSQGVTPTSSNSVHHAKQTGVNFGKCAHLAVFARLCHSGSLTPFGYSPWGATSFTSAHMTP
jgi:hypothetical protein